MPQSPGNRQGRGAPARMGLAEHPVRGQQLSRHLLIRLLKTVRQRGVGEQPRPRGEAHLRWLRPYPHSGYVVQWSARLLRWLPHTDADDGLMSRLILSTGSEWRPWTRWQKRGRTWQTRKARKDLREMRHRKQLGRKRSRCPVLGEGSTMERSLQWPRPLQPQLHGRGSLVSHGSVNARLV
jgi:hypothetical protein